MNDQRGKGPTKRLDDAGSLPQHSQVAYFHSYHYTPPKTPHKGEGRSSRFGDDILGGAGPAVVREVEHDPVGVPVFGLVERIRRCRPPRQIGAAGIHDLLFGRVEVVDPDAEMIEAELL